MLIISSSSSNRGGDGFYEGDGIVGSSDCGNGFAQNQAFVRCMGQTVMVNISSSCMSSESILASLEATFQLDEGSYYITKSGRLIKNNDVVGSFSGHGDTYEISLRMRGGIDFQHREGKLGLLIRYFTFDIAIVCISTMFSSFLAFLLLHSFYSTLWALKRRRGPGRGVTREGKGGYSTLLLLLFMFLLYLPTNLI
jgi:hypothetical protein